MHYMKFSVVGTFAKCTALAACMLALPIAALAQDDPNAAPPMTNSPSMNASMEHHRQGAMMMRDLDLTDDQKAQLKAIHDKFKADHPDMSTVTKADRKAMRDQIMAVLTPEQRAKWRKHMMSRQHHAQPNEMPTVAP